MSRNGQLEVVEKIVQTGSTFFAFLLPVSNSSAGIDHIKSVNIYKVGISKVDSKLCHAKRTLLQNTKLYKGALTVNKFGSDVPENSTPLLRS